MKYYLLIAGHKYYPSYGTGDWIGCYEYESEAMRRWEEISKIYDWHDIVDLREWLNG